MSTETKRTQRQPSRPVQKRKTPRAAGAMKKPSSWLTLLLVAVCGVAAQEVLHATSVDSHSDDPILTPQDNRGGWINPEDFAPMPQCIAQQDTSLWLSTMSGCTSKRCTRHLGVICTHHQWLTQASCLSTGFSPHVLETYLPYCSRSILAKTQLYQWIHATTGRTWLVDVGDANGLQSLSPASLPKGFAAVSVAYKAPMCLSVSVSARSMESFQHVMASCGFTSTTQHTGRADRPWEYREGLHSMVAMDFETVGYDLTRGSIEYGDYFDKNCFCRAFTVDPEKEPCSGPGNLDWTQEQLWIHATCGPASRPSNWADSLKVTGPSYIPIENWHWPPRVVNIGKQVTGLAHQCTTDACGLDAGGYCKVQRTVSRACVCRNIGFDTCGAACQDFETRIAYATWLHDFCGPVQGWNGLPDNWTQVAAPTARDMIPWKWSVKPSSGQSECSSNAWKIGSIVVVNAATFLFALLGPGAASRRLAPRYPRLPFSSSWFLTGLFIAALQLLANWVNAGYIQGTPGYDHIPITQLVFLWCTMPRPAWLAFLLIGQLPFDAVDFSAAKAALFAEIILQASSAYYMVRTVGYGFAHNFYFRSLEAAERVDSARTMYAGALLWLVAATVAFSWLVWATLLVGSGTGFGNDKRQGTDGRCTRRVRESESYWSDGGGIRVFGETSSLLNGGGNHTTMYGTPPAQSQGHFDSRKDLPKLHATTAMGMFLLWVAQWVFWRGFVGLSTEEYCPPRIALITAVWTIVSLASTTVSLGGLEVVPSWRTSETL